MTSATAKNRPAIGSMKIFRELNPQLVAKADIESEFLNNSFELAFKSMREVLDAKEMVALEFERKP